METGLDGRHVLITGGSRGIGFASANTFLDEGAVVTIAARDKQKLKTAASELAFRGTVVPIVMDISNDSSVESAVGQAVRELGDVSILINNAGAALPTPFAELTSEKWIEALNYKLVGYSRCVQAILPSMRASGNGKIVNVIGTAAREPNPWSTTTGAVNAALTNYTKTLSGSLASEGILVNAVSPGPIATDRWNALAESDPDSAQTLLSQIPVGRPGAPSEVAAVVAFLASGAASFVTGTTVHVDGGRAASVVF